MKKLLIKEGVSVHRDMNGPVDSINGRAVMAFTRMLTDEQLVQYLKENGHSNFAFYQRFSKHIRFASW